MPNPIESNNPGRKPRRRSLEVEDPKSLEFLVKHFEFPTEQTREAIIERLGFDPDRQDPEPTQPADAQTLEKIRSTLHGVRIQMPPRGSPDRQRLELGEFGFELGFFDDENLSLRIGPVKFSPNTPYYDISEVRVCLRALSASAEAPSETYPDTIYFSKLEPEHTYEFSCLHQGRS